ncbi:hypothetical protein SMKI_11G2630 [Saccharomyces mikatae IFO 1815]|uniref:glycogenin glucosyltransferase n=1 Tax=Saccharomyces mikatae IFO 1815 TaxID=226126 RepID=A0AA35IQ23_SACMI|nr:uncharacterized protein SMKI_11G2630 [Saccharomyces mikatae IFO 1815]CAI4034812.1 hypothetical protein SMKI_11G2630 [Saccharomyces mikatae IFO 1815]
MYKKLAIATLLYSADYLPGVFALGYQLNKLLKEASKKDSIETCLIVTTPLFNDTLSDLAKNILNSIYTKIVLVNPLAFQNESIQRNSNNLALLGRPELSFALIKARLWELTQFEQVLYLDSDTLPLNKEFLRLFDIMSKQTKSQVGAVADIGWPDMFNSGVMMLIPDADTASVLQNYIIENTSIDGSDQGTLNQFFNQHCCTDELLKETFPREWVQLSFIYNVTIPNLGYQSSPALNYFKSTIKLIHFIGKHKPWSLWSQKNFTKTESHNKWNEIYEEFKEEHELEDGISKLDTDSSIETEPVRPISPVEVSQSNEPAPNQKVEVLSTQEENMGNQDSEPVIEPVPLDFTKWLTTFVNKDYPTNQSRKKGYESPKENGDGANNNDSNPNQENPSNHIQKAVLSCNQVSNRDIKDEQENVEVTSCEAANIPKPEQKSSIDNIQESSAFKNHANAQPTNKNDYYSEENSNDTGFSPLNSEQKGPPNDMQKPNGSEDHLPGDEEPHALIDENIQYLEKEKEGYEEFLPDVYETNTTNHEEDEFFDDSVEGVNQGGITSSVATDTQKKAKPTEGQESKPQQEMPNFKFDWEDTDYLSKVERCFPDDIFEYAVE